MWEKNRTNDRSMVILLSVATQVKSSMLSLLHLTRHMTCLLSVTLPSLPSFPCLISLPLQRSRKQKSQSMPYKNLSLLTMLLQLTNYKEVASSRFTFLHVATNKTGHMLLFLEFVKNKDYLLAPSLILTKIIHFLQDG